MPATPFQLTRTEWLLLRTLELGDLDLEEAAAARAQLEELGLAAASGSRWTATDYGKFLVASRRTI